jgi:DNA end-binding protein Ku
MAVQSIWSGTISFSLVAIPVRLVTAVQPGHISFHLLHSKDYSRLSRRMICPEEGASVPPDEIVRGFEVLPGKYVLLTDEELESVSPERSRTIEIIDFIVKSDVDPVYYDHHYFLVPAKGGEKAYQLLVEVMERSNKAGLARFVLSEREYLVAITSRDGALMLTTLHYRDEVLPDEDLWPKKGAPDADEKARMKQSIEGLIADFDPGKYADGRRKKIREMLDAKVKAKALVSAPVIAEEEGEGPADLVAALEESMRKVKESR